ncbi:MAG: hypothetical protein IMZ69_02885, partial [Spirochaetes bacterium]|nr:hypothetical protein [Spirochaetota bacterium]
MLELVIGERRNRLAVDRLIDELTTLHLSGTLYVGYPVVPSADQPVMVDALLASLEHGVVVFDLSDTPEPSPERIIDRQNDLAAALQQRLLGFKPLRRGRTLALEIRVVTVLPDGGSVLHVEGADITTASELPAL